MNNNKTNKINDIIVESLVDYFMEVLKFTGTIAISLVTALTFVKLIGSYQITWLNVIQPVIVIPVAVALLFVIFACFGLIFVVSTTVFMFVLGKLLVLWNRRKAAQLAETKLQDANDYDKTAIQAFRETVDNLNPEIKGVINNRLHYTQDDRRL